MPLSLQVITGGKDVDAKEAREAARRRARPILRKFLKAIELHISNRTTPKLLHVDYRMAAELANYPSANEGRCYAGQKRLASKLGICERSARSSLTRLRTAGFLRSKRGGPGYTASWTFCLSGVPIFCQFTAGSARPVAAADRQPAAGLVAGVERQQLADKPYEQHQPKEYPLEQSAMPSPPPTMGLRAQGTGEIAADILAAVPPHTRRSPVWRGLSAWIDDTLAHSDALPVDVVMGVTQALGSLKTSPSTLRYFDAAVRRARAARVRPFASDNRRVSVSAVEGELCRVLDLRRGSLMLLLGEQKLAALHSRYSAGEMLSEIANEIRDEVSP